MIDRFLFALLLTTIAGLSTTIGSFVAFIFKKPSPKFISFIMGFSAGVMILVSFVELLATGIEYHGLLVGSLLFLLGMGLMYIVDTFITHYYEYEDEPVLHSSEGNLNNSNNKNSMLKEHFMHGYGYSPDHQKGGRHRHRHGKKNHAKSRLEKTSILIFLGVFIHNLPEGMATFLSALSEVNLGIMLTIAIALHNIPEGIAVATTVFAATGDKKKAFRWSFFSGLSEPIGALVVGLILFPFINIQILSALLAVVAGFMVYISLDELLPLAHSLGKEHTAILGIITGMGVIAMSLVLLQ